MYNDAWSMYFNYRPHGKSKKVRVIGSSKQIAGSKEKTSCYSALHILIIFNCRNVISESWKILLDYKSERNVTEHTVNRVTTTSASTSKLIYAKNTQWEIQNQCLGGQYTVFSRLFKRLN